MYPLSLEREFTAVVAMWVFNHTVKKIKQYNKDMEVIDIPEFLKLPEDKIVTKADQYVANLIREGKLYQTYCEIYK